jgi:hypothetical protein
MKRDGLESDYEKVRRRAGIGLRKMEEFPEEGAPRDAARVEADRLDFHNRMEAAGAADRAAQQARNERAAEHTERANKLALIDEYRAAGLWPGAAFGSSFTADGTPAVSLSLLLKLGWTIGEVDGAKTLIQPRRRV